MFFSLSRGYGKDKKLPSINSLKQEYAVLLTEKKRLYADYHASKKNMQDLVIAKGSADKILGVKEPINSHTKKRSNTQEI